MRKPLLLMFGAGMGLAPSRASSRLSDFTSSVSLWPTVPHVHVHVIPREPGDGGRNMLAMWPGAPPIGSVPPDFAELGGLAERLQAA